MTDADELDIDAEAAAPPDVPDVMAVAHGYVRRGWGVVPLYGVDEAGQCRCEAGDLCPPKNRGKHPRGTRKGWRVFTSGADVQAWFDDHLDDNIGVATGQDSGMFVLDVDGPAGIASINALATEHGPLPPTRLVRTGSGGLHYFFRHPGHFVVYNSAGYLAPGIDIRGKGGQVVAPPSVSGRGPYELLADHDLAEAPFWLLAMLGEHSAVKERGHQAAVMPAEQVDVELVPERVATMSRQMVGDGGRHTHFYGLVAACFEAGFTQGQTVTIVAPWCAMVDKFVGRIPQEVARTWGKLQAEAQRANEWVPGLGDTSTIGAPWPATPPPPASTATGSGPAGLSTSDGSTTSLPTAPSAAGSGTAPPGVLAFPTSSTFSAPPVALVESTTGLTDEEPAPELPPTWAPVDLGPILDGSYVPETPALMPRLDGVALVYRGRVHSLHGESESGKSLVCQYEVARVLLEGGTAAYLDFESDAAAVTARLLDLGAPHQALRDRFTYRRPDVDPRALPGERNAYGELLANPVDLVVIDGMTDALNVWGASSNDLDEVTTVMRRFPRLVATRTGAGVLIVDHVTKDADSRGRHAVGSQAKLNGLDGAGYVVEVVEAIGRGLRGTIVLRLAKDRIGYLRAFCGPFRKGDRTQEAARITVDSTEGRIGGPAISVVVGPPIEAGNVGTDEAAGPKRLTYLMERVSRTLEDASSALSGKGIETRTIGKAANLREATRTLVAEGFVEVVEGTRGDEFAAVRAYRSEEDPASGDYLGWAGNGTQNGTSSHLVPTSSPKEGTTSSPDPLPPTGRGRGSADDGTSTSSPTSSRDDAEQDAHVLVSCKSCFRPTETPEAEAYGGRCGKCAQLAGLVTEPVTG